MPLHLLENANPFTGIIWVVAVNDLSGHVLKVLREDDGFTLLRGHRMSDSRPILAVASHHGARSGAILRRLENEYAIAGELEPAWAARPIELLRRNGGATLILEDPGGYPLDSRLGSAFEMTAFLRVAVGLDLVAERGEDDHGQFQQHRLVIHYINQRRGFAGAVIPLLVGLDHAIELTRTYFAGNYREFSPIGKRSFPDRRESAKKGRLSPNSVKSNPPISAILGMLN